MNREIIFNNVQDIFRDVFDEDTLNISDKTSSDDIEEWDSLNQINLVSAIEKEFNIKFSITELISLKDVGSMIDLMILKL